ncbi:MAG: protochlorophyllide reductase iron-sulfur ATP-binding protein [Methanomassiliicoccales archaeon PtaB.Bin215]|nr:MAG: protochlorophyllide reductase iron-sulfur ATP-binding protein [Methanomassiliicoccales archaeon PtaB.Bin215]
MSRTDVKEITKQLRRNPGNDGGQRILVAGKGGVGKTTLSAALCLLGAAQGRRVLAVDQDAQQNLAYSLGYPPEKAALLRPITQELDYVEEKVGARPGGGWGGIIGLNPDVSDVTERFGVRIKDNLHLLVMGGVVQASTGCLCPENSMLGALVRFLNSREDDLIVMDAQAGLEPFGRTVAEGFGTALVVSEPTFNSLQVAARVEKLSRDLGMRRVDLVLNKCRGKDDLDKVVRYIPEAMFDGVHELPLDPSVLEHEPDVSRIVGSPGPYMEGVKRLFHALDG